MASTTGALYRAGQVKATNADLYVRTLGFKPKKVRLVNLDNQVQVEASMGLDSGQNLKTVAAGDLTVVSSGVTLEDADSNGNPGFKVPAALADINDTTTETLFYEAWGD